MAIALNNLRQRKTSLGGIDKVYLFPWVSYSLSQIVLTGQQVTTFPATTLYEYYSPSDTYNETTEIEGGDVAWNQNLSLQLPKTMELSEAYMLSKQLYRAIYIDRLDNIRILGLYNGLDAQITNESGAGKPDFNGYRITLTGREDNQAYYIDNLTDVGFTIYDPNNYVFQDGCNFIYQDGNNYIFQ